MPTKNQPSVTTLLLGIAGSAMDHRTSSRAPDVLLDHFQMIRFFAFLNAVDDRAPNEIIEMITAKLHRPPMMRHSPRTIGSIRHFDCAPHDEKTFPIV